MAAPLPDIGTFRDVALTAGEDTLPDLLAPWIDQFNTASADATTLTNNFFLAPAVGLQQMIANQAGFWQDFFNDPTSSTVASISQEMQSNLDAVLSGAGLQGADSATTSAVLDYTLSANHQIMFGDIPGYLPADEAPIITPIINFLASPESGILMGALGPGISPWVALLNSVDAGDSLNDTLANMVGAYFNGATLDLDSLLPAINAADVFPPGMTMTGLDIGFGGLLSTGSVEAGPYEVGGSIFNSVGLSFTGVPFLQTLDVPSEPIGPIGAWEALSQTIATLIGWDGSSSPLAGVDLPIIPADFLDSGAGAASAATDLSALVQDFVSLF